MNKKFMIWFCMILLVLPALVQAAVIYETYPPIPKQTTSGNYKGGIEIIPKIDYEVLNITKFPTSQVHTCYVLNGSYSQISTAKFVGNDCPINQTLNASETVYLIADAGGSSVTLTFNSTPSFPYDLTYTNFSAGFTTNARDLTTVRNIANFTFTIPDDTISIIINSPDNVTSFAANNFSVSFNYTESTANTGNCTLYINETANATIENIASGTNNTVINATGLVEGGYSWVVGCNTSAVSLTNTSERIAFIDYTSPVLTDNAVINNTQATNQIVYNFTGTDLHLKNFTLTSCNHSYTNTSVPTPYTYASTTLTTNCSLGIQNTVVTLCDNLRCTTANYTWDNRARLNITAINLVTGLNITSYNIYRNGTLDGNTTVWYYHLDNLTAGDVNVTIDNASFERRSAVITMVNTTQNYLFEIYTTNSFNFTIIDEQTEELVTKNTSIEFISDTINYTYYTATGKLYVDVLSPEDYTIRYSAPNYGRQRHYFITLTNRTHNDVNLYLLNNTHSSNITLTVYNQLTLTLLEDAMIYIQRRMTSNIYTTVAMYETDVTGKGYVDLEKSNEYYRFLVDYPWGTRVLETSPLYVETDNINMYVNIQQDAAEQFFDMDSITYSLVFDETTQTFILTWTDNEAVATNFCLYLKEHGQYGATIFNNSCSTSSSGSISLGGMDNSTNETYYATFKATISNEEVVVANAWKDFYSDKLNAGQHGLFLAACLMMVFAFLSYLHYFSVILGVMSLLFSRLMGLIYLDWNTIFIIIVAGICLSVFINMKKGH